MNISDIQKDMEVVGADGQHVGLVDNLGFKLTKNDPQAEGHHHYLKLDTVASVEGNRVTLAMPASEALTAEKIVQD